MPRGSDRARSLLQLRRLSRRVAWEGAKLAFALGVRAGVRRLRAGPLLVEVVTPRRVNVGETFAVQAEVESPHPLEEAKAYYGGVWVSAKETSPGLHRETWWFRAKTPGLRPVLIRLKDTEGHVQTATRWIWVRSETEGLPEPRRVRVAHPVAARKGDAADEAAPEGSDDSPDSVTHDKQAA